MSGFYIFQVIVALGIPSMAAEQIIHELNPWQCSSDTALSYLVDAYIYCLLIPNISERKEAIC
jgi:hypothetical protein